MDDRKSTVSATKFKTEFKTVCNNQYTACLLINFLLVYKSIRKVTLESTFAMAKQPI